MPRAVHLRRRLQVHGGEAVAQQRQRVAAQGERGVRVVGDDVLALGRGEQACSSRYECDREALQWRGRDRGMPATPSVGDAEPKDRSIVLLTAPMLLGVEQDQGQRLGWAMNEQPSDRLAEQVPKVSPIAGD